MWRRAGAGALLLALLTALATLTGPPAWAGSELRLAPAAGPAGAEFAVTGAGFAAAPVEIRWGSQSGPVLGMAAGPEFSVTATVPDAAPNSYQVVAVVREGNRVSTSTASYQVTPATAAAGPPTTTTVPAQPAPSPGPVPTDGRDAGTVATGGTNPAIGGTAAVVEPPAVVAAAGSTAEIDAIVAAAIAAANATVAAAQAAVAAALAAPAASATTTVPSAGDAPSLGTSTPPAGNGDGMAGAAEAADEAGGRALGPTSTSQSSGAVRSPILLLSGLGLVLTGGVALTMRARRRPGA